MNAQEKIEKMHLLGLSSMPKEHILEYLRQAETFIEVSERDIKKVPALRGKTILNVFLEPSTRTRVSFEIAGKRLSADTINISGGESSVTKGETLLDTARTLQAMRPDVLVLRSKWSRAPHFLAQHLERTCIVNAGDGTNEHPTQALLDLLTLHQHFKKHPRSSEGKASKHSAPKSGEDFPHLQGLKIAIVGDVRHSRVARSNVWAHLALGNHVRLVGPPGLVPVDLLASGGFLAANPHRTGTIEIHHSLESGLEGVDVVMVLRLQKERMKEAFIGSLDEYSRFFGVSSSRLNALCPSAILLHPGPANRGVEISGDLMYGHRSLIEQQVQLGVAVRMAVLFRLATQVGAEQGEVLPHQSREEYRV